MADLRQDIYDVLADHPMWNGIDYSPVREAELGNFLDAVMPLVEAYVAAKVAEAKAEAKADALREAADQYPEITRMASRDSVRRWLNIRADVIEGGAS
jgi:hypothetical protein